MAIPQQIQARQREIIASWPFSTRLRNAFRRLNNSKWELPSPECILSISTRRFRELRGVGPGTRRELEQLQTQVVECMPLELRPRAVLDPAQALEADCLHAGLSLDASFWRLGLKTLGSKLGRAQHSLYHFYYALLERERDPLVALLPCAATCSRKVLRVLLGCGVKTTAQLAALDDRQVLGFENIGLLGWSELWLLIEREGGVPRAPLPLRGVTQRATTTPAVLASASPKMRARMLARMKSDARWAFCRKRDLTHAARKRGRLGTRSARMRLWRELPRLLRGLVPASELALLTARWRPGRTLTEIGRDFGVTRERIRQRAADAAGAILADDAATGLLVEVGDAAQERVWVPSVRSFHRLWGSRNFALMRAVVCEIIPGMREILGRRGGPRVPAAPSLLLQAWSKKTNEASILFPATRRMSVSRGP